MRVHRSAYAGGQSTFSSAAISKARSSPPTPQVLCKNREALSRSRILKGHRDSVITSSRRAPGDESYKGLKSAKRSMSPVVIDFDKVAEVGLKGVRRAAVFMGLGLNAAHDPAFKSYQLSSIQNVQTKMHMELIPSNVNDDTLAHFKTEFGVWTIANGLREVTERYAVFLDGIHQVCQLIACSKQKLEPAAPEKRDSTFRRKGIEYKLQKLDTRFGVKPQYPDYLISINKARNCLTHRLGKVGSEDCNQGQALEVKWTGMDFQIELESGKILSANEAFDVMLPEPGTAQLKFVERNKSFPIGTFIRFEMHDLAEICNFMPIPYE